VQELSNSYSFPNTNEIIKKEEARGTYRTLEEMRSAFKIVVGQAEKQAYHLEDVKGNSKWKNVGIRRRWKDIIS